jgi:hypothetical protein
MSDARGGWGTLAGVRLKVLVLVDPERAEAGRAVVRAIGRSHDVTLLAEKRGTIASHLEAARAARAVSPRVVHGVGARGFGAAAAPIARGIGAKLVVSLAADDLVRCRAKQLARLCNGADAVLLDDETIVAPLRAAGLKRSVYILPSPSHAGEDASYLAGIEIAYGRILAGEAEAERDEAEIVQIGGLRKSPER